MQKERDELLQRDAETHQRIIDLLAEVKKEQDLGWKLRRGLRP